MVKNQTGAMEAGKEKARRRLGTEKAVVTEYVVE